MNNSIFINRFSDSLKENKWIRSGQKILLAVSGGADSVVMCHLFKSAGIEFGMAHCNFRLREKDSEGDAAFVNELADQMTVPFYSAVFETRSFQKQNKLSLEEAARILRYNWLEEIRKEFQYDLIATAHHLNDSIETVLLNLVSGTGINGILGIPERNKLVVRPMLFATKMEILAYATENNIAFRTDTSNFDDHFDRNLIRNQVIPVLQTLNPSLEKTFEKNILHFKESANILNETLQRTINKLSFKKNDADYIPAAAIKNHPAAITLLHFWLNPLGFNPDQSEQILQTIGNSGKIFLSHTHRLLIDRKYLILSPLSSEIPDNIIIEKNSKNIRAGKLHLEITTGKLPAHLQFNTTGTVAYFDADKIEFPLLLRKWRKGDYLYPLGLTRRRSDKPGKKKVSDILTNNKTDALEKENTYVICAGDHIIWLVGIRQDERFKVTPSTKNLLKIRLI